MLKGEVIPVNGMQPYGLVGVMDVGVQLHVSAALFPGKKSHGTHSAAGWMGSRPGLNALEKRKIFFTYRKPNHDSLVVQPET
jgi:hypothetical protein